MPTLPVKYGGNPGEQMATLMCVRSVVVEEQAVAQRLYSWSYLIHLIFHISNFALAKNNGT